MQTVSAYEFRKKMKELVDLSCNNHEPVAVIRRNGEDFVVISMNDYISDQETIYVMQNDSLREQLDFSIEMLKNSPNHGKKIKDLDK